MNDSEEDGFTNYTTYKIDSELHKVDYEILSILTVGAGFGIAGFLTMCIQLCCNKASIKNKLYCYFNFQHTFSSVLHLILITYLYKTILEYRDITEEKYGSLQIIAFQVTAYLSVLIPLWTACISLKMFADLLIFENGANMYSIREVSKFAYTSALIVQFYEEIIILCLCIYNLDEEFAGSRSNPYSTEVPEMSIPAVRLTSILLILSVPISMLFIILLNLIRRNDESRFMSVIYFVQLLILISADVNLVVFKVRNNKILEVYVCAAFLSARIIFEVLWTVLIKSDIPILKHFNYY